MIVPPGLSRPSRSAASIIGRPMRSLTEPPGLSISSLARRSGWRSAGPEVAGQPGDPDERGVADEVEDRLGVLEGIAAEYRWPLAARRADGPAGHGDARAIEARASLPQGGAGQRWETPTESVLPSRGSGRRIHGLRVRIHAGLVHERDGRVEVITR